jgi:hypothetical protein
MSNAEWLQKYRQLNDTFKPTCVFRVGTIAGFFSEYNHMVFAIVYCLNHQIKFVLSSVENNFSIEKGWQDFFLPFCEETHNRFHCKYNMRGVPPLTLVQDYSAAVFRKLIGVKYLTYQVMGSVRQQQTTDRVHIPALGLEGDFFTACQQVVAHTWVYQPAVAQDVASRIARLALPSRYVGVHIRGGDKAVEHKLFTPADYMRKVQELTDCKAIFVATDDYETIRGLQAEFPAYTFFTSCSSLANGYQQEAFNVQHKEAKRNDLLDLFADVDMLSAAELFVGTYSSNVGMYVGMRRNTNTCHALDFEQWRIW